MSERVPQSYDGKNRAVGKSTHPNQSVWMSHWTQTSARSSSELEIASDACTSIGRSGEASGTRSFKLFEKGITSSTDSRMQDLQSFPMFNLSRGGESSMVTKSDIQLQRPLVGLQKASEPAGFNRFHGLSLLPPDPVMAETSTRGTVMPPQGTQWSFEQSSKSHCFPKSESLTTLRSLQDDFMGSAPAVSTGISPEKSPVQSLSHRKEKFNQLNNPLDYQNHSAFLQREKVASHPQHRAVGTPSFGKNGTALLLQHPSSSNHQLLDLFGEKNQQMQNDSAVTLFPGQSCPLVVSESDRLYHEYYSLQTAPYSVHDVETVRICATVEDIHTRVPRYTQMTRHLLVTERMDANISDNGQTVRGAMLSTNLKRKAFGELLSLSPPETHGRQRLKLQLLEGSDSEKKEKGEETKGSEEGSVDKSSAKTDSIGMEPFQTNRHLYDLALSPSNKDIDEGCKHITGAKLASTSVEIERRTPIIELPDINEEPPALLAAETSMNDAEQQSTSRTQSLDVDHLISQADHPSSSKSPPPCLAVNLGLDPSSRWVKRLKVSSSDSDGHGTKSLKMEEASSNEKMSKYFHKNLAAPITCPDTRLSMSDREGTLDLRELPQSDMLVKNCRESSSTGSMKEYQNISPSHFWIRRWCSQAASSQKKPDAVVICEPHSPKAALDDFQKKQFPSIAAMALMGKALYGFPPCEFRKRGPLMVWNTNAL